MYTPKFTDLVGDEAAFFTNHQGKAPLLRRGGIKNPAGLLSIGDLDQILHQEALRAEYVRVVKNGELIPESAYTRPLTVQRRYLPDVIVPDHVYAYFRVGASVVWNTLNHLRPNLRAVNAMLADKLAVGSESTAFLTPPGGQGFAIHHDSMDAFVIHLHGTKRWRVWQTDQAARSAGHLREAAKEYQLDDLPSPILDTVLEAGDVLYLPACTPHVAIAQERTSLHVTVTVVPPTWSQLTQALVRRLLEADAATDEYVFLTGHNQVAALGERLRMLAERLTDLDPAEELLNLTRVNRIPAGTAQGRRFQDTAALDDIDEAAQVTLSTSDLAFRDLSDGRVRVESRGTAIAVPKAVRDALTQLLLSGKSCSTADFIPEAEAQTSMAAVRALARIGILQLAHDVSADSKQTGSGTMSSA